MTWTSAYDPSRRPTILDLREYLSPTAMALLERLNSALFQRHRVKAAAPRYTKTRGWVFPYQSQGVTLFTLSIQEETGFFADEIPVTAEDGLALALEEAARRCQSGFLQRVEETVAARKERRKARRPEPEAPLPEAPPPGSDPEKLNKFSWTPALPPAKLRRLYRSSADGMLDHDLLEEVGLLFYTRCRQGTEEYALLQAGKLKCHHCGAVLSREDGLMVCGCGYQYTFREYRNSFSGHHMPGGSAQHIFTEFVKQWPSARTDAQKMNRIDWMIHQCHISMFSGLPLRSVLKNLIDAPQQAAEKLILELAYGGA